MGSYSHLRGAPGPLRSALYSGFSGFGSITAQTLDGAMHMGPLLPHAAHMATAHTHITLTADATSRPALLRQVPSSVVSAVATCLGY